MGSKSSKQQNNNINLYSFLIHIWNSYKCKILKFSIKRVNKNKETIKNENIINNKGYSNNKTENINENNKIPKNTLNINQIGDINRYYEIKEFESQNN